MNSEYYIDGVFQVDKAKAAYFEMFKKFHYPICPALESDQFWVQDFGLKKFPEIGLGGIFWWNNEEYSFFGHDIFLLPDQCLPQHAHVKTNKGMPKMESWHIRYGSAYLFGEGECSEAPPVEIPESQKPYVTALNWEEAKVGDVGYLKRPTAPHFIYAGSEGVILTEYGTFHDDDGLRWANPNVSFSS